MSEKIYFYQNNPCTIVNEVNEDFVEIAISHRYGAEMELMCQGCAVGDSDNKLTCTCAEHDWIVEQLQDEEHLTLVIARRIYLTEDPVEYFDIVKLQKEVKREQERLDKIKALHEEWRLALNQKKADVQCLAAEADSLKLSIETLKNARRQSEKGIESLEGEYNSLLVHIEKHSINNEKISNREYQNLLKRDEILTALEAGGVDNWTWYDEALKEVRDEYRKP